MEAPPGMKKGVGLSSWYTSSSTSSSTMTKEEFMGAELDKFIQQGHPLIAEELVIGEGHHLEALVTLAMVPRQEQSLWLKSTRKDCLAKNNYFIINSFHQEQIPLIKNFLILWT